MDFMENAPSKKRLIDANKLLKNGISVSYGFDNDGVLLIPIGDVIRSIKNAPTVNDVEVVRCSDCKHLMFSDCYGECDGAAERRMIMDEIKNYPPYLDYPKPCKPQTNADRIRAMSDEELAEMLWKTGRNYRAVCADPVVDYNEHRDHLIAWLQQTEE